MSIVFNLYYNEKTGDIVGYHEGGAIAPANETPKGCKLLSLDKVPEIWDKGNFRVKAKVDVDTMQLIHFDAPKVLTPTPESPVNPLASITDPNAELKHA